MYLRESKKSTEKLLRLIKWSEINIKKLVLLCSEQNPIGNLIEKRILFTVAIKNYEIPRKKSNKTVQDLEGKAVKSYKRTTLTTEQKELNLGETYI